MRTASVLEPARLRAVLRRLNAADRARAITGLTLLEEACRGGVTRKGKR